MKRTLGLRHIRRQAARRRTRSIGDEEPTYWRPQTRADCQRVKRPCCFVGCRFNLFLDTLPEGGIHFTKSEDVFDIAGMRQSCALDVADRGPLSLDDIGELEGLTRERVRQIEFSALSKLRAATDHLPEFPVEAFVPPPRPQWQDRVPPPQPPSPPPPVPAAQEPEPEELDEDELRRAEILALFGGQA